MIDARQPLTVHPRATMAQRLPLTQTAPPCAMKEGKSAAAGEGSKEGGGGQGEYDRSIKHHLKVVQRLIVLLNELLFTVHDV